MHGVFDQDNSGAIVIWSLTSWWKGLKTSA